ncbi:Kelch repeat-containing protein [Vitis vinifera]|uniref:Kelch repeat-containing protein n=1 Tax=Vitis vinifera TaxID=29760 RepID=A0A438BT60_VITVI|nr:Kelch repeat-containing protein [Vitis vinifera]
MSVSFSNFDCQTSIRACVVVDDRLFVIGGQEVILWLNPVHLFSSAHGGMRYMIHLLCSSWGFPFSRLACGLFQVVYEDVYMLDDDEMKWKVLPPMPKPDSHIEFAWVVVNNSIIIVGGTTEKHPVTKRMILVGEVFQFHLDSLIYFLLPITEMVSYWKDALPSKNNTSCFLGWMAVFHIWTAGQRPDNPQPRKVIGDMWRTKLSF